MRFTQTQSQVRYIYASLPTGRANRAARPAVGLDRSALLQGIDLSSRRTCRRKFYRLKISEKFSQLSRRHARASCGVTQHDDEILLTDVRRLKTDVEGGAASDDVHCRPALPSAALPHLSISRAMKSARIHRAFDFSS